MNKATARRYWEIWGDAEHSAQAFKMLGILSAATALLVVILAYRLANKPPLVILASEGNAAVVAAAVGVPAALHRDVAVAFTQRLLTYGPRTYRDSVLSAARLLEADAAQEFVQRLMDAEAKYVAAGTVQSFTYSNASASRSGSGYRVVVHGSLTTSEGGKVTSDPISFEVTTKAVRPSEENPYGAAIATFRRVQR